MDATSFRRRLPSVPPALTLLASALLSIGILVWAGRAVSATADARRLEIRRAQASIREFDDLRGRYQPVVAAESIAWRRTLMELQDLGVLGDDRLAVTQAVSRTAESAGLSDVKVLIGQPDTTGLEKRLSTEGIRRKPASFGLQVECRGGLRAVITFLGRLPPAVAVTHLSLLGVHGGSRHRISLAVYELTFTNGPPPSVWSPVEPGAPGGRGGDRPGG